MKIYYDQDADLGQIRNKKVAIIGYGSQGHAHALNLKDSGVPVVVGLREGGSWLKAEKSGLKVMPTADAVKSAEIVMLLAPDEAQGGIYRKDIAPHLRDGAYLAFGHGFNIHFGQIVPPATVNVFMVAPRDRGIWYDRNIRRAAACRCCWRFTRTPAGRHVKSDWPMRARSAAEGPA